MFSRLQTSGTRLVNHSIRSLPAGALSGVNRSGTRPLSVTIPRLPSGNAPVPYPRINEKYSNNGTRNESARASVVAGAVLGITALSLIDSSECQGESIQDQIKKAVKQENFKEIRTLIDTVEKGPKRDQILEFLQEEAIKTVDSYYFKFFARNLIEETILFIDQIDDNEKRNDCFLKQCKKLIDLDQLSLATITLFMVPKGTHGKDNLLEKIFFLMAEEWDVEESLEKIFDAIESSEKKGEILLRLRENVEETDPFFQKLLSRLQPEDKTRVLETMVLSYAANRDIGNMVRFSLDIPDQEKQAYYFSEALKLCFTSDDCEKFIKGVLESESKPSTSKDACLMKALETECLASIPDAWKIATRFSSIPDPKKEDMLVKILEDIDRRKDLDLGRRAFIKLRILRNFPNGPVKDKWMDFSFNQGKVFICQYALDVEEKQLGESCEDPTIFIEPNLLEIANTLKQFALFCKEIGRDFLVHEMLSVFPEIHTLLSEKEKNDFLINFIKKICEHRITMALYAANFLSEGEEKEKVLDEFTDKLLQGRDLAAILKETDAMRPAFKDVVIQALQTRFPERSDVQFLAFANHLSKKNT